MIGGQSQEQKDAAIATVELKDEIKKFIEASQRREESNQRLTCFIVLLTVLQVIMGVISLCSSKFFNQLSMSIFKEYLITFGWAVTGAISMAIALGIGVKIYSFLTPINEWEEVKKGNIGAAIIIASVIIGFALVIGLTIS